MEHTGESSATNFGDHSFRDRPIERAYDYQPTLPVTRALSHLESEKMDIPEQAAIGEGGECEVNDSEAYERQQRRFALQQAEQRSYDEVERRARTSLCSGVLAHLGLSEKPLAETHGESLLIALRDKDVTKRIAAAHTLSEQEHLAEQELYEELIEALTWMAILDETWQGRTAALRTLGRTRQPGMAPIQELLSTALEDPHKSVRAAAAQALGEGETPETEDANFSLVINALTKATNDSHWSVREAALESMGKLQLDAFMSTVTQRLRDEDSSVRVAAVLAFASLAGEQAIPSLEIVARNDHEQQVRRAAITAIGRLEHHQFLGPVTSIEDERKQDSTATSTTRSSSTDILSIIGPQAHQQEEGIANNRLPSSPRQNKESHSSLYKWQEGLLANHEALLAYEKQHLRWMSAFIRFLLCLWASRTKRWIRIYRAIQLALCSPKQGVVYSIIFAVVIVGAMHALHTSAASLSAPQALWISPSIRSGSIIVHPGQQFSLQLHYQPGDFTTGSPYDHYQLVCTALTTQVGDCMGTRTTSMKEYIDGTRNQIHTSLLYLKAPSKPGMYHLQWQIKNSAGILSTKKATIDVIVQPT